MKKTMLVLFILSGLSINTAQAEDTAGKNFAANKAEAIANLDKRIAEMTEKKACFNAANNKDDMKACRTKHRDNMKGMKEGFMSRKAEKKAMRDMKKKKRAEKKAASEAASE